MSKFNYSKLSAYFFLLLVFPSIAQKPKQLNSSEIYHELTKLNTLGRVLYLAAHPDDENQRIITYFDNEIKVDAAYLSLTRGDGGQNLVGSEIRESLGIIRTQELLEARRVDGGEQFFSRANDFGYSKSADETLATWDKSKILGDVVWVIRNFRPDIIITRFPPDERAGHGHHTSSAMLAKAAFEIAGDPEMYPEQLKYVSVWQPKRVFINTGRWWNDTISKDTPGVVTIDVGKYNPLLGESYTEIAARSRTSHKSQGFGATGSRGEQLEYLELMVGEKAEGNALEGIDLTWNRVEGGQEVKTLINEVIAYYDFEMPELSVRKLIEIRKRIEELKDDFWKKEKQEAVNSLIIQCSGLYFEMTTDNYFATTSEELKVKMEIVNRSGLEVKLNKVTLKNVELKSTIELKDLLENNKVVIDATIKVPENMETVQPYWLKQKGTLGTYKVNDQQLIGTPENEPCISAVITVLIEGESIDIEMPLVYKWNDPVKGEQYKPFVVLPDIAVNIDKPVYIFNDETVKKLDVNVKSFKTIEGAIIEPLLPTGWKSKPERLTQNFIKGEEKLLSFEITPPNHQVVEEIGFEIRVSADKFTQSFVEIDYDHIQAQTYLPIAKAKLVKLDVNIDGKYVGYIEGAGDQVPEALQNIGFIVEVLEENTVMNGDLDKYDAIMLGIRALNTNERIDYMMPKLLKYSENGGNLIIQYNTNHRLKTQNFAPYELKLSRDRVSDEFADVRILQPDHEVLNSPNRITSTDFDDWVQERGLYFPNTWSSEYDAILSMNDKGEDAKEGSLLVAKYGKGYYVYSGLSFFRELPAGVTGAYRLLANIISLGSTNQSN